MSEFPHTHAPCRADANPPFGAGYAKCVARRGSAPQVPFSVWYPTRARESSRRIGIYDLSAAFDAEPAQGRYGLVLISHGSGGSDINHHDWAETLARNGFVVAAPRHVGDSYDINRGLGSREQLLERPRQVRAVLRAVLDNAKFAPLIDRDRIGMFGFSAGGYTTLILLGAHPDFRRWGEYCRRHPETETICPYGVATTVDYPNASDWDSCRVAEIKAAVLLAPFAILFDAANIRKIRAPVRVYRAKDDAVAVNSWNADAVAAALPNPPEISTEPGGHYVFIAPIDAALAKKYREFYEDAPGVDRPALHRRVGAELVDYFTRRL